MLHILKTHQFLEVKGQRSMSNFHLDERPYHLKNYGRSKNEYDMHSVSILSYPCKF